MSTTAFYQNGVYVVRYENDDSVKTYRGPRVVPYLYGAIGGALVTKLAISRSGLASSFVSPVARRLTSTIPLLVVCVVIGGWTQLFEKTSETKK
jgi:hypothetical protein